MRDLVSVVIPTVNRANLLVDAINSALQQRYVNTEVIVIDDGSTDNTSQILERFAPYITFYCQENKGVSCARNLGLSRANGEYIVFLDSDDIISDTKLSEQVHLLRSIRSVEVNYSRWKTINLTGQVKEVGVDTTHALLPTLLCKSIAVIHACMFRTDTVLNIRGFDEHFSALADWDLLMRLALAGCSFSYYPAVTAIYRLSSSSMSLDRFGVLDEALRLNKKIFTSDQLPEKYRCYEDLLKSLRYLETASRYYASEDLSSARGVLDKLLLDIPQYREWFTGSLDRISVPTLHLFPSSAAHVHKSRDIHETVANINHDTIENLKMKIISYICSL